MTTFEIDDFIDFRPTDGLYLVSSKPTSWSKTLVGKVCDLPDSPFDFASMMMKHEELANFLVKFRDIHRNKTGGFWPSAHDEAVGILQFLSTKALPKKKARCIDRRIDLDL